MYNQHKFQTGNEYVRHEYNPAIGGASQHNSMPVPSTEKWGGKPETPA